jgi:hypothetical protein
VEAVLSACAEEEEVEVEECEEEEGEEEEEEEDEEVDSGTRRFVLLDSTNLHTQLAPAQSSIEYQHNRILQTHTYAHSYVPERVGLVFRDEHALCAICTPSNLEQGGLSSRRHQHSHHLRRRTRHRDIMKHTHTHTQNASSVLSYLF